MPITNPWLTGPTPTRPQPREQLEERILNLLSTHNTAVSWDASVKSAL